MMMTKHMFIATLLAVATAPSAVTWGGDIVVVDIVDTFSYDLRGAIPPNETRLVDVAGELGNNGIAYDVIGLGWELTIDAFVPSWLSDTSIAFGSDPTYQAADLILTPGLGDDFPGIRTYSSGGIVDLTNWNGQDATFELPQGVLYLEFFEAFDDFIGIPDAWYRSPSTLTLGVVRIPEPTTFALLGVAGCVLLGRRRSGASAERSNRLVNPLGPGLDRSRGSRLGHHCSGVLAAAHGLVLGCSLGPGSAAGHRRAQLGHRPRPRLGRLLRPVADAGFRSATRATAAINNSSAR